MKILKPILIVAVVSIGIVGVLVFNSKQLGLLGLASVFGVNPRESLSSRTIDTSKAVQKADASPSNIEVKSSEDIKISQTIEKTGD